MLFTFVFVSNHQYINFTEWLRSSLFTLGACVVIQIRAAHNLENNYKYLISTQNTIWMFRWCLKVCSQWLSNLYGLLSWQQTVIVKTTLYIESRLHYLAIYDVISTVTIEKIQVLFIWFLFKYMCFYLIVCCFFG